METEKFLVEFVLNNTDALLLINYKEILCKPKILPLKSLTLQKLEELEKQVNLNTK